MATALEVGYWQAVVNANATRQLAIAAAFAAYGYNPSNLATYKTALVAADIAFVTRVNSASTTAGITPNAVPFMRGGFGPSVSATIAS
jgi:hypothetical protein